MTDTHTHLYLPDFRTESDGGEAGAAAAVARAVDSGVEMMVFPNVNADTIEPMKRLSALFPQNTCMAMGLHPTEFGADYDDALEIITDELRANRASYVAVGEIGIDLYWDKTYEREQMEVFDRQLSLASELSLPVIIHCREGLDRTLEVLSGHKDVRAVFHSFGGSADDVQKIRGRFGDCMFGINGIVTFKNSRLREVLPEIGLQRILTETDSPYLTPVPFRGRRNESAYIKYTVQAIATALGLTFEETEEATVKAASDFFRI